jgi:beta-phosphoglucomutase-like phosphatase (HAD superfamily)
MGLCHDSTLQGHLQLLIMIKQRKQPVFIFDMDGTMIDSMPFHAQSWVAFANRQGLEFSVDDLLAKTTGRNGHECMEILFARVMTVEETLPLVAIKETLYRDAFASSFREVLGFKRFALAATNAGISFGVGTAGDKHNAAFALQHLAMINPPDVVVRGDEGLRGKPNPDIFLEVARRLNALPSDCIVFEDAPFGIEAAQRAGMRAVAICSGHSAKELAGPRVIASATNFEQLLAGGFIDSLIA